MEDIKHTYTIQWVGPLSYEEYRAYIKRDDTIMSGYFNFYYFEAQKTSGVIGGDIWAFIKRKMEFKNA